MKILTAVLLCLLLSPVANAGGGQANPLPAAVNSTLNKRFPGWRFAEKSADVQRFFGERLTGANPTLIKGDFDGDGQTDYAVLIEHSNFERSGVSFTHLVEKLAFLRRGRGYRLYALEEPTPATPELYLTLARKGEASRDFHSRRKFRYPHDSITISHFEKAGGTYIFRKGRFRYVYESD